MTQKWLVSLELLASDRVAKAQDESHLLSRVRKKY